MKLLLTGLFVGAGIALAGVLLAAHLGDRVPWLRPRRTVTVTGTATVRVHPDFARLDFALSPASWAKSVKEARDTGQKSLREFEKGLDEAFKEQPGGPSLPRPVVRKTETLQVQTTQAGPVSVPDDAQQAPDKRDDREYGLITYVTVELDTADVNSLQQAARLAVDVALRNRASFNPNAPNQVVYGRRSVAGDHQRALQEAMDAARLDAQKLVGDSVPVEVLEVSEQTPQPVVLSFTNFPEWPEAPIQSSGTRMEVTQPAPPVRPSAGSGPETALDREITCKVVLKFAF
jgi:uncharacterized protein YggE